MPRLTVTKTFIDVIDSPQSSGDDDELTFGHALTDGAALLHKSRRQSRAEKLRELWGFESKSAEDDEIPGPFEVTTSDEETWIGHDAPLLAAPPSPAPIWERLLDVDELCSEAADAGLPTCGQPDANPQREKEEDPDRAEVGDHESAEKEEAALPTVQAMPPVPMIMPVNIMPVSFHFAVWHSMPQAEQAPLSAAPAAPGAGAAPPGAAPAPLAGASAPRGPAASPEPSARRAPPFFGRRPHAAAAAEPAAPASPCPRAQNTATLQGPATSSGRPVPPPFSATRPHATAAAEPAAKVSSAPSARSGATPQVKHCGAGDHRTTIMLRNLPNNYTREMVLRMLDHEGFAGEYDFLYLPVDFNTGACLGYCFVNLTTPAAAQRCWRTFNGFSRWVLPSRKSCYVSWSGPYQGLKDHIERYRNCPVMHSSVPDEYKPILLREGQRLPFPCPTKQVRPPRVRDLHALARGPGEASRVVGHHHSV